MNDSTTKLDLGQLRTQAKELLKAVRAGNAEACDRVLKHFKADDEFRLVSAQLVIARENGFISWNELRLALEKEAPDPNKELFAAIGELDTQRVARLLRTNPDLAMGWRRNEYGWESALHVAAQKGSLEIAKLLVEAGADVYPVRQSDYPPVFAAHYSGNKELTEYLLEASAQRDHGHPPTFGCGIDIILACRLGMLDRVEMHIRKDPFAVYRRGCIGESVLHWPSHNGYVEVVETLLKAGAVVDADEIGLYGGKPLHWSSEHAPTTTRLLLKNGADPRSRNLMPGDFEGYTPLHMCARQPEECIENVDILLAAGADLHALDAKGQTPKDVAELNKRMKMARYLVSQ